MIHTTAESVCGSKRERERVIKNESEQSIIRRNISEVDKKYE